MFGSYLARWPKALWLDWSVWVGAARLAWLRCNRKPGTESMSNDDGKYLNIFGMYSDEICTPIESSLLLKASFEWNRKKPNLNKRLQQSLSMAISGKIPFIGHSFERNKFKNKNKINKSKCKENIQIKRTEWNDSMKTGETKWRRKVKLKCESEREREEMDQKKA